MRSWGFSGFNIQPAGCIEDMFVECSRKYFLQLIAKMSCKWTMLAKNGMGEDLLCLQDHVAKYCQGFDAQSHSSLARNRGLPCKIQRGTRRISDNRHFPNPDPTDGTNLGRGRWEKKGHPGVPKALFCQIEEMRPSAGTTHVYPESTGWNPH